MESDQLIEPKPPDPKGALFNNINFHSPPGRWSKKFIIMSLAPNSEKKTFRDFSPFKVCRFIKSFGRQINVRFLRSGIALLEIASEKDYGNLAQIKSYENYPVQFTLHRSLNFSKGIITCNDLIHCTEEELKEELSNQNVVHVKRIFKTFNGNRTPTSSLILTFNRTELPEKIVLDFLSVRVNPYYQPLICYNCYGFRHGKRQCREEISMCGRCGGEKHEGSCEAKCRHCEGPHPAWAPSCPVYKREKQIEEYKVKNNVSYVQAERWLQPKEQAPVGSQTYSQAASALPAKNILLDQFEKLTALVQNLAQKITYLETTLSDKSQELSINDKIPDAIEINCSPQNNVVSAKAQKNVEIPKAKETSPLPLPKRRERRTRQPSQSSLSSHGTSTSSGQTGDPPPSHSPTPRNKQKKYTKNDSQ